MGAGLALHGRATWMAVRGEVVNPSARMPTYMLPQFASLERYARKYKLPVSPHRDELINQVSRHFNAQQVGVLASYLQASQTFAGIGSIAAGHYIVLLGLRVRHDAHPKSQLCASAKAGPTCCLQFMLDEEEVVINFIRALKAQAQRRVGPKPQAAAYAVRSGPYPGQAVPGAMPAYYVRR
jgi:hypothetical protein